MKKLLILLVIALFSFNIQAQLPDGSVAPDWTLTDINGETHNLYTYLNNDMVVILDFSATWCGPCWSYHNSNAMKNFYNQYGPDATGQAMVIFLEADTRTNTDCLYGLGTCNFSTQGNWVANTPYPIIDLPTSATNSAYKIAYFPTVYGIYPNRLTTELRAAPLNALIAFMNAAPPPATEEHEVRIINYHGSTQACLGEATIGLRVQNYGLNPIENITFEVKDKEGNLLTEYMWTGTIGKYNYQTISFGGLEINEETDVTITARAENQENFEFSEIDATLFPSPETYAYRNVRVNVHTDDKGSETSWDMIDKDGNIMASRSNLENNTLDSRQFILRVGECYQFNIYDSGGDGLRGQGYYNIIESGTNRVIFEGKEFGSKASHGFIRESATSTGETISGLNEFDLYPNPIAGEQLNINLNLEKSILIGFQVIDESGKILINQSPVSFTAGNNVFNLNTQNLLPGKYFLILQNESQQASKAFIKQ
jgi:thiol-disulfide isomerase/thioredoxin